MSSGYGGVKEHEGWWTIDKCLIPASVLRCLLQQEIKWSTELMCFTFKPQFYEKGSPEPLRGSTEASDPLFEHSAGSGRFRGLCWGSVGELETVEVCVWEREGERECARAPSAQILTNKSKSWLKLNTKAGRGVFHLAPDQQKYSERWWGLWASELRPRRLKPRTFLVNLCLLSDLLLK